MIEIGQVQVIGVQITLNSRLHLDTVLNSARLGITDLKLSPRSFELLLSLAEGAADGLAFVTLRALAKRHFEHATNDKALGQGIEDLRNQLGSRIGREQAVQLIGNVRGKGYRLNMGAAEIQIERGGSATQRPASDKA